MKHKIIFLTLLLLVGVGFQVSAGYGQVSTASTETASDKGVVPSPNAAYIQSAALAQNNLGNPNCLDNYQSLPSSSTYYPSKDWNPEGIIMKDGEYYDYRGMQWNVMKAFQDVNGDGLVDYVYNARSTESYSCGQYGWPYREQSSCVYLNNGHGWQPAYRCYQACDTAGAGSVKYYGDCALP